MISYGRQDIRQSDIDAVEGVLRSDFLTQGPLVPRFEKAISEKAGSSHAVAANSATSVLHIACLALELGPGDWLWTSPNTFVASANCARYCGAGVDFVDIDPISYNLCPEQLTSKLQDAEARGVLPKVVVAVHHSGHSCDMEAIDRLRQRYGFYLVEDASHAIGGMYQGRYIGGCQYADITVFSFHPVKIITTAEGGMATTNSAELAGRMRLFRSHGVTRDPALMESASHGPWYYEQVSLGYNYRMTDLQAALGLSQLERLDEYVQRRNILAGEYDNLLSGLPVALPRQHPDVLSARHLYVIRVKTTEVGKSVLFERMLEAGIGVNLHYIPVHLQPYYRKLGFEPGDYPEAEAYHREAMTLPLHPGLESGDLRQVAVALEEALAP